MEFFFRIYYLFNYSISYFLTLLTVLFPRHWSTRATASLQLLPASLLAVTWYAGQGQCSTGVPFSNMWTRCRPIFRFGAQLLRLYEQRERMLNKFKQNSLLHVSCHGRGTRGVLAPMLSAILSSLYFFPMRLKGFWFIYKDERRKRCDVFLEYLLRPQTWFYIFDYSLIIPTALTLSLFGWLFNDAVNIENITLIRYLNCKLKIYL
jgi:hypothetical protein